MIGVALLGAGFMGIQHARGYRRLAGTAAVKVVCFRTGQRAATLARELGAESTTLLDAAPELPGVDAVDVCLPSDLHASVALAALEAGRHVLVQKPVALSMQDAEAMGRAADKAQRILVVATTLRFWPEYQALERLAASSSLGSITGLVAERLSPPITWNAWIADRARSGGTAVDLMIHDLDLVGRYLGKPDRGRNLPLGLPDRHAQPRQPAGPVRSSQTQATMTSRHSHQLRPQPR